MRNIGDKVIFFSYIIIIFYFTSAQGPNSLLNPNLITFTGDILFVIGLLALFSYIFKIPIYSSRIWRIIFWLYIIYLLIAAFSSQTSLYIGSNGIAYSEIEEEGIELFTFIAALTAFGILIVLYPMFRLGYRKEIIHSKKIKK